MRLKDRIQLRINMVEYLRETNCSMQHYIPKRVVEENMNELIKVEINKNQEPVISGRELHKANDRGRLIWN